MKKITKLLMLAVVALGVTFTACNNDLPEGPKSPDEKDFNTHMSVSLKLDANSGSARSTSETDNDEDYNYVGEWAGADAIDNIVIYLVDDAVQREEFSSADYDIENDVYLKPKASAAFKTVAGVKTVYVVINENALVNAELTGATASGFAAAYAGILELENSGTDATVATSASKLAELKTVAGEPVKDLIVMTTVKPHTIDIKANITKDETINANRGDVALNRASVDVERAAARVLVTINDALLTTAQVKDRVSGDVLGELTNITWTVAQGENKLYLQRKDSPVKWETPSYAWIPSVAGNNFATQAGDRYDYSALFLKDTGTSYAHNGTAITAKGALYEDTPESGDKDAGLIGGRSVANGIFILPNTHAHADAPATDGEYTGGYNKGNTAYVLVRATYTPQSVIDAEYDVDEKATGDNLTARDGVEGETFYLGADGNYYSSSQAAYNATKNAMMTKYENGKVLYYAWVNPDDKAKPYNSSVLRNNIYHINVTGFGSIGTNWNPLFPEGENTPMIPNPGYDPDQPEGPDNPKEIPNPEYDPEKTKNPDPKPIPEPVIDPEDPDNPIDPEEPENPIDPDDPLTTPETWMSVDMTVLQWKVHSYDIELEF